MVKKLKIVFSFLVLFFLCACGGHKKKENYVIGIDRDFYPLDLGPLKNNVYGFTQELLLEMADTLNVTFTEVPADWDNLLDGLYEDKYECAVSSMMPFNFEREKYNFSDVFFDVGNVLVVGENSKIENLDEMENKFIGYVEGNYDLLYLEKYAKSAYFKPYDNVEDLLDALDKEDIDGAILERLKALKFINNIYEGKLLILAVLPENPTPGLRLVSKKDNNKLINVFNDGLRKLEENGKLRELKEIWNIF